MVSTGKEYGKDRHLGELRFGLADECLDVVLLFDVFHHYYLPEKKARGKLLKEIHRILKSHGLISVWPKHMESEAKNEIESAKFYLESEYSGTLIHDNYDRQKGQILNFRKR